MFEHQNLGRGEGGVQATQRSDLQWGKMVSSRVENAGSGLQRDYCFWLVSRCIIMEIKVLIFKIIKSNWFKLLCWKDHIIRREPHFIAIRYAKYSWIKPQHSFQRGKTHSLKEASGTEDCLFDSFTHFSASSFKLWLSMVYILRHCFYIIDHDGTI